MSVFGIFIMIRTKPFSEDLLPLIIFILLSIGVQRTFQVLR